MPTRGKIKHSQTESRFSDSGTIKHGVFVPSIKKSSAGRKSISHVKSSGLTFLRKKVTPRLIFQGRDKTPDPLDSMLYKTTEEAFDVTTVLGPRSSSETLRQRSSFFQSASSLGKVTVRGSIGQSSVSIFHFDESSGASTGFSKSVFSEEVVGAAPPEFYIPSEKPESFKLSEESVIILKETETLFLLEIQSLTADNGTEEFERIEYENYSFDVYKKEKGKIIKVMDNETQTKSVMKVTRSTLAERKIRINVGSYVTDWQLYDTYSDPKSTVFGIQPQDSNSRSNIQDCRVIRAQWFSGKNKNKTFEEMFRHIHELNSFQESVCLIERMLAGNNYWKQQEVFQGVYLEDPLSRKLEYKYSVNLLWIYSLKQSTGRTVSAVCWNPLVKDILAVGYGRFKYTSKKAGLVCCWNIKNPRYPERRFKFEAAVTSLDFSRKRPNHLGVGLENGSLLVIDVVYRNKMVVITNKTDAKEIYEPIWFLCWVRDLEIKTEEAVIISTDNGRILRYIMEPSFHYIQLMRVTRVEGDVSGVKVIKKCLAFDIQAALYPSATTVALCPTDKYRYLAGTDEGAIHVCSMQYINHHMEVFMAHAGPVYTIKYSPFCRKMFLTCGADWCVRLWIEDLYEPLVTLTTSLQQVQDADWNPINSTVIASVSENEVFLWDLTRKALDPASVTRSSVGVIFTRVMFSKCGNNLIVGDVHGNVHVFGLSNMPFSPFYQEDALINAVIKSMTSKPELIKRFQRVYFNFSDSVLLNTSE